MGGWYPIFVALALSYLREGGQVIKKAQFE